MDAENGVALANGNGVVEKTVCADDLGPKLEKENENVENGVQSLQVNGVSEDSSKRERLNTTRVEDEVSVPVTVTESKSPNVLKKSGTERGNQSKNDKLPKDQASQRGLIMTFPHNQRQSLSHSVRKSNVEKQVKTAKNSHVNGTDATSLVPNGSLISTSGSRNSNRRASAGEGSVSAKDGGLSSRRNTLASVSSTRRSMSASVNAMVNNAASKAHESTSPHGLVQCRSSGSGFSFRLDERAEKRKQFFSKLEEKTHAKEMEQTNLQEKSRESEEAEIKHLRKSLTFKATPMPSFYKEPCPPKAELKKTPTTRPMSPKFGRHKSSFSASDCSPNGNGSCRSLHLSLDASRTNSCGSRIGNGDSTSSNKPVRMSLSKLPSPKPLVAKPKIIDLHHKSEKTSNGGTEENRMKPVEDSPPKAEAEIEPYSILDSVEDEDVIISLPDPPETN